VANDGHRELRGGGPEGDDSEPDDEPRDAEPSGDARSASDELGSAEPQRDDGDADEQDVKDDHGNHRRTRDTESTLSRTASRLLTVWTVESYVVDR